MHHLSSVLEPIDSPVEKVKKLHQIIDVASNNFQIITIIPSTEIYTYQLYQVVNDRGEPLKDSELLKAKSLEVFAGDVVRTDEAKRIWNDILCDPGPETEKYLNWCYMSKVGNDKGTLRYYHAYLHNYFKIQESATLTEREKETFMLNLNGLYENIKICRKLSRGIWPFDESSCHQWQKNVLSNLIVGLKHTLCIPVLISAARQPDHHGTTTEQNFYTCLELCETFFVLIKGVLRMREDKFKSRYLSAAVKMRTNPIEYRAAHFQNDLKEIEPTAAARECFSKLQEMTYAPKAANATLKYLLILLEMYFSTFDANNIPHPRNVPDGTNLVYSELSVEHIYAENASPAFYDANLEMQKHKLGNLLPYGKKANSRLKSKAYMEKRSYYEASRFITVTSMAAAYPIGWSAQDFTVRHNDVCKKLEKLLLRFYN